MVRPARLVLRICQYSGASLLICISASALLALAIIPKATYNGAGTIAWTPAGVRQIVTVSDDSCFGFRDVRIINDQFSNAIGQSELVSSTTTIRRVYGIPLPCIGYDVVYNVGRARLVGGVCLTGTRAQPSRVVPHSVELLPLVVNTLILTAVLLACSRVLSMCRKRKDRSEDACSNCGYSLVGLTALTCPECGIKGRARGTNAVN